MTALTLVIAMYLLCNHHAAHSYLLGFSSHERENTVLVVGKVCIQQWRPSLGVPTVNRMAVGDQGLHARYVA